MITILLEKIITILEGWLKSFTSHAQHVEDKLDSLDQTASDIKTNTEPISDIADNTGAVITPTNQIKTNTDSIKTDVTQIKTDTGIIKNNVNSIATSAGSAAAFAEDCATNTLDIKDKITTIASDTTQLRADSGNIAADVSSINQALGYYLANTPVTEDVEGDICNFDTDLTDYLQACKITIPADLTGFSGITLTKKGKNYIDDTLTYQQSVKQVLVGQTVAQSTLLTYLKAGTYTVSSSTTKLATMYYRNSDGYVSLGTNNVPRTFTINEDMYVCFYLYTNAGLTPSEINWFLVETGDTATAYEPYKAMTYPVSFGTTITDGAEVDLLEGVIKINSTPVSYQSISPIAVRTYKGINNIYSDIGTTALTYRETLKHYLAKNNQ